MAGSASPRNNYFFHVMIVVTIFFIVVRGGGTGQDYKDALRKAIIFFEGQRSGFITREYRQGNTWRGNSALNDGREANNKDLTGGYYDAGDNEKFNFPMAFTTTMLSWSVIEFGESMGDEVGPARGAIRWGTDYLIKCAFNLSSSGVLYVGVGDGSVEHGCWERPEDIGDQPRAVYSVSKSSPGSEVAAETAAALAAASIVFQKVDRDYSNTLLDTAKLVFEFANNYQGQYNNQFYPDYSRFNDELIWGAAWLLKATTDYETYANIINNLGGFTLPNMASWDNKYAAASVLLSRNFFSKTNSDSMAEDYSKKAESFICTMMAPSYYTRGGLMYLNLGGINLQYVTAITFLMATYGNYMADASGYTFVCGSSSINSTTLKSKVQTQVDYILGNNPMKMSYMVGYGSNYPKRIHHRASSIPSIHDQPGTLECQDKFLKSSDPNPNELIGAIVGGPDVNDEYQDDRNNYGQSEPATYINAPFVGTLAYLARN